MTLPLEKQRVDRAFGCGADRVVSFLFRGLMGLLLLTAPACSLGSTERIDRPAPHQSVRSAGFTNFETEPVRPLLLSADRKLLFALHTAADRLIIYDTTGERLDMIGTTRVGMRPVALAQYRQTLWVVNHLSDSVSVVDISNPRRPTVLYSLRVGDEPRGIAIAGTQHDKVFIATAKRADSFAAGVGRGAVWVFDATNPSVPPKILTLFGTKLRALAASPDGRQVYAGVFHSGNGTTSTSGEAAVKLGHARQIPERPAAYAIPKQGAIVQRANGVWRDFVGRDWNQAVPFELPDYDIFVIDAAAESPDVINKISGVGTVLFDIAVRPGDGELWVTNTEAMNFIPFESRLQGKFATNRITTIRQADNHTATKNFTDLNRHIDHGGKGSARERQLSLAQPLQLQFANDGERAYVAAFGSGKIGVLDRSGEVVDRLPVGFGPSGLAVDERRQRLFVLNHLDASIAVVDLLRREVIETAALGHDPTPAIVRDGRRFLYDASLTSRHGDLSCATCHVFGNVDGVAWDLGDPSGQGYDIPGLLHNPEPLAAPRQALHPLKGPMMTQSLRGLNDTAPYHWRGDRFGDPNDPGRDISSFSDFNGAFVDLMGRSEPLMESEMAFFARFVMTIRYPPNPIQPINRGMTVAQKAGFDFFTGPFPSGAGIVNCEGCHQLPHGTNRKINFEDIAVGRDMKTAQLRNIYDKVGRFNVAGPQVSGYGFLHDGSMDTVAKFLRLDAFVFPGDTEVEKDKIRSLLQDYIVAFDTGMAPAVGRQVTVRPEPAAASITALAILSARARAGDCDLIAKGWQGKRLRGWLLAAGGFQPDRSSDLPLSLNALLSRFGAAREPLTFTCVPLGDGRRSGLDRDLDGRLDGDHDG